MSNLKLYLLQIRPALNFFFQYTKALNAKKQSYAKTPVCILSPHNFPQLPGRVPPSPLNPIITKHFHSIKPTLHLDQGQPNSPPPPPSLTPASCQSEKAGRPINRSGGPPAFRDANLKINRPLPPSSATRFADSSANRRRPRPRCVYN